jgi:hypothetical protein
MFCIVAACGSADVSGPAHCRASADAAAAAAAAAPSKESKKGNKQPNQKQPKKQQQQQQTSSAEDIRALRIDKVHAAAC